MNISVMKVGRREMIGCHCAILRKESFKWQLMSLKNMQKTKQTNEKTNQKKMQEGFNSHRCLFHWSNTSYSVFDNHNQDLKEKKPKIWIFNTPGRNMQAPLIFLKISAYSNDSKAFGKQDLAAWLGTFCTAMGKGLDFSCVSQVSQFGARSWVARLLSLWRLW